MDGRVVRVLQAKGALDHIPFYFPCACESPTRYPGPTCPAAGMSPSASGPRSSSRGHPEHLVLRQPAPQLLEILVHLAYLLFCNAVWAGLPVGCQEKPSSRLQMGQAVLRGAFSPTTVSLLAFPLSTRIIDAASPTTLPVTPCRENSSLCSRGSEKRIEKSSVWRSVALMATGPLLSILASPFQVLHPPSKSSPLPCSRHRSRRSLQRSGREDIVRPPRSNRTLPPLYGPS